MKWSGDQPWSNELKAARYDCKYGERQATAERLTFALFSVEGDLHDVRTGFPRSERDGKLVFVDWSGVVGHASVVDGDLKLAFARSTHVHCTPQTKNKINLNWTITLGYFQRNSIMPTALKLTKKPKKSASLSKCHQLLLKTVNKVIFFVKFWWKKGTIIVYVGIKYSTRDLICDVINRCVWSCDIGKISVYDNIVTEYLKREK